MRSTPTGFELEGRPLWSPSLSQAPTRAPLQLNGLLMWRVDVPAPAKVLDLVGLCAALSTRAQIARPDRRGAVAAGDVEHIGRLTEAGQAPVQTAHQGLAFGDRGAQMRRAGRKVAVVEVVGLDAALDERPHQRAEGFGVIVHAAQQHTLA